MLPDPGAQSLFNYFQPACSRCLALARLNKPHRLLLVLKPVPAPLPIPHLRYPFALQQLAKEYVSRGQGQVLEGSKKDSKSWAQADRRVTRPRLESNRRGTPICCQMVSYGTIARRSQATSEFLLALPPFLVPFGTRQAGLRRRVCGRARDAHIA